MSVKKPEPHSIFNQRSHKLSDFTEINRHFTAVQSGNDEASEIANPKILAENRHSITYALKQADRDIAINPARLKFMSEHEREQLKQKLLRHFYSYNAKFQIDCMEDRIQSLQMLATQIKRCAALIEILRFIENKENGDLSAEINRSIAATERNLKYFATQVISPILANMIFGITMNESIGVMSAVNYYRIYFIWAKSLIDTLLSLFISTSGAQRVSARIAPVTGYMSFVLYDLRLSCEIALCLKHTIAGPWMSIREQRIPWNLRFKMQLEKRKFRLMNDFFWSIANTACFFLLTGSVFLLTLGARLMVLLLLMDASLIFWSLQELSTEYTREEEWYQTDIRELTKQLELADQSEREDIQKEIEYLNKNLDSHRTEWRFKTMGKSYDLAYAVALIIAFLMMSCCLIPPGMLLASTSLWIGLAGAGLCFLLTVAYFYVNDAIPLSQLKLSETQIEERCLNIQNLLIELKAISNPSESEQNQMRALYLDWLELNAETGHQRDLIAYQRRALIYTTFIRGLFPILVFSAFVCLPLNLGLGVLAAGFSLSYFAYQYFQSDVQQPLWRPTIISYPHKPKDLNAIDTHHIILYYDKNTLWVRVKNALGLIDDIEIKNTSYLATTIKTIRHNELLTAEQTEQIFTVLATMGYEFNHPSFDENEFQRHLEKLPKEPQFGL